MNSQTRRVHRLRLKAQQEDDIHSVLFSVEDGMHTASLPGLPRHGLVLIKTLNLGTISTTLSPMALANKIDRITATISPDIITAYNPDRANAVAVWFADDILPCVLLAEMLSKGVSPTAWYWPKAVNGWQKNMTGKDGLRLIITNIYATENPQVAIATLLDHLVRHNRLDPLLAIIKKTDIPSLPAAGYDEKQGDVDTNIEDNNYSKFILPRLSANWQNSLHRWIVKWGKTDHRSLWLVSHVLGAQQIVAHPVIVNQLINVISSVDKKQKAVTQRQHIDPQIKKIKSTSSVKEIKRSVKDAKDSPENKHVQESGHACKQIAAIRLSYAGTNATSPDLCNSDKKLQKTTELVDSTDSAPSLFPKQYQLASWHGLYTVAAGLPFLIPILDVLGIRQVLEEHPILAAMNLPAILFQRCCLELGIDEEDPINHFFTRQTDGQLRRNAPIAFNPPAIWHELITEKQHASLAPRPGSSLLLSAHETNTDCSEIATAFLLAAKLYLQTGSNIELDELVLRPGRITLTPTHLDMFFKLDQADIRIRQAGLDLNPGWVEWLGRVVNYHYRHGAI